MYVSSLGGDTEEVPLMAVAALASASKAVAARSRSAREEARRGKAAERGIACESVSERWCVSPACSE